MISESNNGKVGKHKSDVAVIGAPCDLGVASTAGGQRLAPDYIRDAYLHVEGGLIDNITGVDFNHLLIADCGDVEIVVGDLAASHALIEDRVREVRDNTELLLILGGDDSLNVPALAALDQTVQLVHLDAHNDVYVDLSDIEFVDHGSWVAVAIDRGYASHVIQVGNRALGPDKAAYDLYRPYMTTVPDLQGLTRVLQQQPTWVALDIDVVDPAYAPGTGVIEPGGFTSREVLDLVDYLMGLDTVLGLSITEVLPDRDVQNMTVALANRLMMKAMEARA